MIAQLYKALLGIVCMASVACSTVQSPSPKDPLESFNRSMFAFNNTLDGALLKPIAKGYTAVVPKGARECVSNVFDNLKVPFSALNNVLQGKFQAACEDMARFVINTSLGLGGCFDIASEAGIPNHREDFGQTLGHWGVPAGPYIVLPVLGSSTLRDTAALISPTDKDVVRQNINHVPTRNTAMSLRIIELRAGLLKATDALDNMDVDKYSFVRDAHLSRRQNAVYDGDPPDEEQAKDVGTDTKVVNGPNAEDVKTAADSIFSTFLKLFR